MPQSTNRTGRFLRGSHASQLSFSGSILFPLNLTAIHGLSYDQLLAVPVLSFFSVPANNLLDTSCSLSCEQISITRGRCRCLGHYDTQMSRNCPIHQYYKVGKGVVIVTELIKRHNLTWKSCSGKMSSGRHDHLFSNVFCYGPGILPGRLRADWRPYARVATSTYNQICMADVDWEKVRDIHCYNYTIDIKKIQRVEGWTSCCTNGVDYHCDNREAKPKCSVHGQRSYA